MSEFYTFPHIESLARRPEVFALSQVVALEKVDGTNARFGLVDGHFVVGSRNQELTGPDGYGFYAWVQEQCIEARLRDAGDLGDIIVYGEWYGRRIQKGVTYSTGRHFRGFAVRQGRTFMPVLDALEFIDSLGLDIAPVLYVGYPDVGTLDGLRVRPSKVARLHAVGGEDLGVDLEQNTHEGVVIWPIYPFMDAHGEWVIAKHKNPTFEETRSAQTGKTPAALAADAQAFVTEYATEQRFQHVISALGVDVADPRNIGAIMRAFVEDAAREGAPDYERMEKDAQKQANRLLNAFAKQQLALDLSHLSMV